MSLLNKAEVKRFIVERAKMRGVSVTKVSAEVYPALEQELRRAIEVMITRHPRSKKVLMPNGGR